MFIYTYILDNLITYILYLCQILINKCKNMEDYNNEIERRQSALNKYKSRFSSLDAYKAELKRMILKLTVMEASELHYLIIGELEAIVFEEDLLNQQEIV